MFVTWILSMCISNTSTTAMMIPIVLSVLDQLHESDKIHPTKETDCEKKSHTGDNKEENSTENSKNNSVNDIRSSGESMQDEIELPDADRDEHPVLRFNRNRRKPD